MATCMLALAVTALVFAASTHALQNMIVDIGVRSYDGKMMHCNDGLDRPYVENWKSLPKEQQPKMRPSKNGPEPYIADDGNAWVSFVSADHERRAFAVSSDGFEAVWSKFQLIRAIEDVSGKDYVVEMSFKTTPTNYEKLEEIAQNLAQNKAINHEKDAKYRGTDYVIDLVFAVVDEATKKKLKESSNNWPVALQLLDIHYQDKLGESAFTKRNIPLGKRPNRSQLSREVNINEKRFAPRS